ncbi:MAG: STAS domain-containing protein [Pseudomonadota bacterium]
MAKEDSGRLFRKVAKFVRNPLKDWSELDRPDATPADSSYSREELQAMLERRQRNDFVRRREFDALRKLRQREASPGADSTHGSSLHTGHTSRSDSRALTLRKIDEIEAQMSQQWWKARDADDGDAVEAPSLPTDPLQRAYADTLPGMPPRTAGQDCEPPTTFSAAVTTILSTPDGAGHGGIEEAAVRFAQRDDTGAEAVLLQMLAPHSPHIGDEEVWLTLLDLYRAIGNAERFDATGARYGQRFLRSPPPWMSFRVLAHGVRTASVGAPAAAPVSEAVGDADWRSEPLLQREGLGKLTRALTAAGARWSLDWRALTSIAPDAASPLRVLFAHWAGMPVDLRWMGGNRLLAVLEEATPTGDRHVEDIWWQLRMTALRLVNDADAFELVALNYCITYEVAPPSWEDPLARCTPIDPPPAPANAPVPAFALSDFEFERPAVVPTGLGLLAGDLAGPMESIWQRLDTELARRATPVISCAALVRVDLAAAGELRNWVAARAARGERVHLVEVHRLLAGLFRVAGIASHASVALRH